MKINENIQQFRFITNKFIDEIEINYIKLNEKINCKRQNVIDELRIGISHCNDCGKSYFELSEESAIYLLKCMDFKIEDILK